MTTELQEDQYKPIDSLAVLKRATEPIQQETSLEDLLRDAEDRPLTREDIREQKVSWLIGMMPRGLAISREQAEKWVDELS